MDALLSLVVGYTKKEDWDQLCAQLDKSTEAILKNPGQWDGFIQALTSDDITKNTIPLIWIGSFRAQHPEENPVKGTIALVESLIVQAEYEKQLSGRKKVMDKWRILLHRYAELCREMKMFRRGLHFVRAALDRFQPTPNHLTPAHVDYLMLSMKGCMPHLALPLINTPIFDVEPSTTGVNATDFMLYYYYAGLALISQKQWNLCLKMLECAMSIVAYGTSAIMVEAYKLYLLVGVIAKGKFLPIPKRASGAMERVGKQLTQEYMDFASACDGKDHTRMNKLLQDYGEVFEKDNLLPLVEEAQVSVVRHTISGLTKVYVTLSLADMGDEVQLPTEKVQEMLLAMIADGGITAKINRTTGMVSFTDENDGVQDTATIEEGISRANEIVERVNRVEDVVALSVPFVAEKLRNMPNYRELMQEFEAKRKSARGVSGMINTMLNIGGGGGGAKGQ